MEWVKSKVDYYRHFAIAMGSDAVEVMFKRGDALAGELAGKVPGRPDGFIPDAMLGSLSRASLPQARKHARHLVDAGLWERVDGGYLVVDFADINDELVKLARRKATDRQRKKADRAAARTGRVSTAESTTESVDQSEDPSVDASADVPRPRPGDSLLDHKSKSKTAAAAAGDAAAAAVISPVLDVLRSKLQAHTPLRGLRFDSLRPDQAAEIETLVAVHGDDPLVSVAVSTCRAVPPVHAAAFLGTWAALPPPGKRLASVRQKYCPTHSTPLSPSGTCSSCASDQKAAR